MSAKNQIHYYPDDVRRAIDAALKTGGRTLDELLEQVRADHAERLAKVGKEPPSRSALGRYSKEFEGTIKDAREVSEHSRAWVSELGHAPEGDVGRMLVQMLQSLSVKSVIAMRNEGALDLKSLVGFALAAQKLASADETQVKRADLIRKRAREELIEEQKKKLSSIEKQGGTMAAAVQEIKREVYGL